MPLVVKRESGQGIKVGEGDAAIWIYVALYQPFSNKISVAIAASQDKKIIREELLLEKGPLYDKRAYKE